MAEILEELKQTIIDMKVEQSSSLAQKALDEAIDPLEILNQAMIPALKVVGERFKRDEIFLPEVMLSAKAFKGAFELLKPKLLEGEYKPKAKVVMGTVQGDVHDIGKNIVCALLEGNGYQVIDLGVNVSTEKFISALRQSGAEILGMSTLLTTTMPEMEKVIQALEKEGLRQKVKVIIGGAPVSAEFAQKIGADGYGEDAQQGVELINSWLAEAKKEAGSG